jgi:hypothetical protein
MTPKRLGFEVFREILERVQRKPEHSFDPAKTDNKDTKLTSAAPDLLEALEELLTRMRISGPQSSIEKARKAIAKAKGKS